MSNKSTIKEMKEFLNDIWKPVFLGLLPVLVILFVWFGVRFGVTGILYGLLGLTIFAVFFVYITYIIIRLHRS
jgi:thiamine transporter ThiT